MPAEKPNEPESLDALLQQAHEGRLPENDFIRSIKGKTISSGWLEQKLRIASVGDEWLVYLLLDCVDNAVLTDTSGEQRVLSLLCQIMEASGTSTGLVEDIADALGYYRLQSPAMRALVNTCTSPRWHRERHWPDLRKALESILTVYRIGACTRDEVIEAYTEILNSPNTLHENCGLRSTAASFIALVKAS